jgi:CrcB protein
MWRPEIIDRNQASCDPSGDGAAVRRCLKARGRAPCDSRGIILWGDLQPVDLMWVGLGGGLGSVLRWWIGRLVGEGYKGRFPLGTFLINISGSLVIGYLSVLFKVDWHDRHGHGMVLNAFVLIGVLGGYTTFSSMQLDAARLAAKQHARLAALYLSLSVAAGLLAALAGAALARVQG